MKRRSIPTIFILIILITSILALDLTRRYLSGEFDEETSELEFLYSSEKAGWLESVVDQFEKEWSANNSGKEIKVIMTPIGSGKGTNQVANAASKPAIWSPASSFWLPILNLLWRTNHDTDIVNLDESLSLVVSPTIIATWKSYQEEKGIESLQDLHDLAQSDSEFTFAHTDPFESNSGFGAVIMEASAASGINPEDLTLEDLARDDVQSWMRTLESAAIQYGSSTGFLARLMASEGPSNLKAAMMYENLILEKNQELTDEQLVAVYPTEGTVLNDHPVAILNADWVSDIDREHAEDFISFLRSVPIQEKGIEYGFRPAIQSPELDLAVSQVFNESVGVLPSLANITIFSVANIPGEILERIPDLWSATRARSLGGDSENAQQLQPVDFIIPSLMVLVFVFITLNPVIQRVKRYFK